jgi:hypothetical protein
VVVAVVVAVVAAAALVVKNPELQRRRVHGVALVEQEVGVVHERVVRARRRRPAEQPPPPVLVAAARLLRRLGLASLLALRRRQQQTGGKVRSSQHNRNRKRKEGGKEGIFFFNCKRGGGGAGDLGQYTLLLWSRKGGGPRMRSAVQGWTWALRGLGAQSTAAAGSASLQPPLPEDDDDDDSRNSPFMALEGILPSFLLLVVSKDLASRTKFLRRRSSPLLGYVCTVYISLLSSRCCLQLQVGRSRISRYGGENGRTVSATGREGREANGLAFAFS